MKRHHPGHPGEPPIAIFVETDRRLVVPVRRGMSPFQALAAALFAPTPAPTAPHGAAIVIPRAGTPTPHGAAVVIPRAGTPTPHGAAVVMRAATPHPAAVPHRAPAPASASRAAFLEPQPPKKAKFVEQHPAAARSAANAITPQAARHAAAAASLRSSSQPAPAAARGSSPASAVLNLHAAPAPRR